jgi:hypothetical protein
MVDGVEEWAQLRQVVTFAPAHHTTIKILQA